MVKARILYIYVCGGFITPLQFSGFIFMQTTRLCIVRHGETDWNAERRLQGQVDIGLNATGRLQAQAMRARLQALHFAAAYSSDLARAWHTAEIALAGADLAVSPAPTFRERDYGRYQGLTAADAARDHPAMHAAHQARDIHYDYGTGESLVAFAARVKAAMQALAERHVGEQTLIFTHGGVLDIIYRLANHRDLDSPRDFAIPNAALNWLAYAGGEWRILAWADQSHLAGALDEVA
jgi:probable phosphoglycerate mutase